MIQYFADVRQMGTAMDGVHRNAYTANRITGSHLEGGSAKPLTAGSREYFDLSQSLTIQRLVNTHSSLYFIVRVS